MHILRILIPGTPMGKGAARHTRSGFTYTPAKTRSYMAEIKTFAQNAGALPVDAPCYMEIVATFPIPKSYSTKKAAAALNQELRYTKKPDTDNLSKIKDALNGVAFRDDSLVYKEYIEKKYGVSPSLLIQIFYEEPWSVIKKLSDHNRLENPQ